MTKLSTKMVRIMLSMNSLPKAILGRGSKHYFYVQNKVLKRSLLEKTPHELWVMLMFLAVIVIFLILRSKVDRRNIFRIL